MKKILETKRTYLRELVQDDLDDLNAILQDPITMIAYEHAFSDEEAQGWLDNMMKRYQKDGFALWAVIDKETEAFLGQIGLTMQLVEGQRLLEAGWLLKRKYWHMGYAVEAGKACIEYAFNVLKAPKIYSIIKTDNVASQNVAKRNGMTIERSFIKRYMGKDMPHFLFSVSSLDHKTVF